MSAANDMGSKDVPPIDRVFALNLILISTAGMLLTFAILYYTDLLPTFSDLLGLGGALTWLAVVSRLLMKDRTDALQEAFDEKVLRSRRTCWVVGVFVVFLVFAGSFVGTIELQQMTDTPRRVWLNWNGDFRVPAEIVVPGQRLRFNVLTTPWPGRRVTIKVNALPAATVKVWPWFKTKITIPGEFLAPVLLVRASPTLMKVIMSNPKKLRITIDDKDQEAQVVDFDGRAFWIGCDPGVEILGCDRTLEIPERLLQSWRAQPQVYQDLWTAPQSLKSPQLAPYSTVKLQVVSGSVVHGEQSVELRPYQRLEEFPREVVLELKTPANASTDQSRKESPNGQ